MGEAEPQAHTCISLIPEMSAEAGHVFQEAKLGSSRRKSGKSSSSRSAHRKGQKADLRVNDYYEHPRSQSQSYTEDSERSYYVGRAEYDTISDYTGQAEHGGTSDYTGGAETPRGTGSTGGREITKATEYTVETEYTGKTEYAGEAEYTGETEYAGKTEYTGETEYTGVAEGVTFYTHHNSAPQPPGELFPPNQYQGTLSKNLNIGSCKDVRLARKRKIPGEWEPKTFQWLPAKDISAAVLLHHLIYHDIYPEIRDDESCERVCCKPGARHLNLVDAVLVLYRYNGKRFFLIDSPGKELSRRSIKDLEDQSRLYASTYEVKLNHVIRAEFLTSQGVEGEVYPSEILGWPKPRDGKELLEATVCSECKFWTPYGVRCLNCQAWLSSIDESFSASGSIGAQAIKATEDEANSDWGYLGGNASSAAFGAVLAAIIFMTRISGALGGA
ncbi:hypothetical protein EG329_000042 [Mollisiaceae sp. DMI_Dod_QoI]|nr:hypothetical protein EG329_000042 [Helotiales sp. DMI_Dod_QoI]